MTKFESKIMCHTKSQEDLKLNEKDSQQIHIKLTEMYNLP